MKKKVILIIMFILGLSLVITPIITDRLYNINVDNLEKKYDKIIKLIDEKRLKALTELLEEENKKLYINKQISFKNQEHYLENAMIDLRKYGLEDNIFGFIEIPSIDIKLPIYLGANEINMKKGAVHLTGTSYPIGGNNTNSVIAAHRGYYKTRMFRHINKINIGDKLYIKNYKTTLEYKAVKIDIIKPTDLNKLTIKENKDMVTIISCHPFPYNHQRYAVYFERIAWLKSNNLGN